MPDLSPGGRVAPMISGEVGFVGASHTYTIGGWVVPGITAIMKGAGKYDERWIPRSARDRGSLVHRLTEEHDLGFRDLGDYYGPVRGWCLAYLEYLRMERPRVTVIEQCFYHRRLGFATTIDRAGYRRGPMVQNLKSGPADHMHEIQSAGELLAIDGWWTARRRETVYLRENGTYEIEQHDNDADRDEFLDALHDWRTACHSPKRNIPLRLLSNLSPARRSQFVSPSRR